MKNEKDAPTIQQSNGLYNSVDVVNTLQNNQNLGQTSQFQQTVQPQINQNGQVSQYQQPVANQIQDDFPQNSNYPNGQDQTHNQNNTNLYCYRNYSYNCYLCFCFI